MIRVEAAEILKEILITCASLEGKSIKLMPPDADSVISKGYQIHIQKTGDGSGNSCIHRIAKKHNLRVHEEDTILVLFKPL